MSTINLKTEIPGPKSKALAQRRNTAVPRGLSHGTPIYVAKAEDAWLEDVDGNRYIDFAGGIGCLNVGHRREPVITAIRAQLENFLHTCVQVTPYENYIRLAERMNEVTPGNFPKKTLFVNSGAEAVENAVKIARAHTGRPGIIAFEDAFHGRTMMTLALTSKTHPYKAGIRAISQRRLPHSLRVLLSLLLFTEISVVRSVLRASSRRHFQTRSRIRRCGRRDRRASLGRRRIRRPSARLFPRADRHLPQARHPLHRRRSAKRLRPNRQAVRQRALRHRTGYYRHRQIARRRFAASRDHRPRRNHGRTRTGRSRRNVRRQSAFLRSSACRIGHLRP